MKSIFIIFTLLFTLIPQRANAQANKKAKLILFETYALAGWGSSKIATDANVPSIGTFTVGAGIGLNIKKFSLGISYDYRVLTQYSDIDSSVGNRRGTFVSPASFFLRLNFEKVRFGLALITSGTYELTNITSPGQKVIYTDPSGIRFDVIFKKRARFTPLVFVESVSFSGMLLDGVKSSLAGNLTYTNLGGGIKYEF